MNQLDLTPFFTEPDPKALRRTRAIVVLQGGKLAAESYAPGFSADMPLPGWSMTKSVLSALIGVLVGEGKMSLADKRLTARWRRDERRDITLEDLLRMRSGLEFSEVYDDPASDATRMLFVLGDAAAFAAAKPLAAPPGTLWNYSSGTSNILSRLVRDILGDAAYPGFPRRALFEPLGMDSAVLEQDAGGTFLASSYMFATARDWARFGQLYLEDGVCAGRRLLPEGWTRFCASPTPQSQGRYGAHWWLKLHDSLGGQTAAAERLPQDAFHACGHEGQVLSVIPSRRLVVVRLGLSIVHGSWDHAAFLAALLDKI